MKHLECSIRQTAVTHFPAADALRKTTGPVKNICVQTGVLSTECKGGWSSGGKQTCVIVNVNAESSAVLGVASGLLLPTLGMPGNI